MLFIKTHVVEGEPILIHGAQYNITKNYLMHKPNNPLF